MTVCNDQAPERRDGKIRRCQLPLGHACKHQYSDGNEVTRWGPPETPDVPDSTTDLDLMAHARLVAECAGLRRSNAEWERLALDIGKDYFRLLLYAHKLEPVSYEKLLENAGVSRRLPPEGIEFRPGEYEQYWNTCASCQLLVEKEYSHAIDGKVYCADCAVIKIWDRVAAGMQRELRLREELEQWRRAAGGYKSERDALARDLNRLLQYHHNHHEPDSTYEEIKATVGICEFRE